MKLRAADTGRGINQALSLRRSIVWPLLEQLETKLFFDASLFADIRPFNLDSAPAHLLVVGDLFYFAADDGIHGAELWKSDGTPEGTVLVKDINPGPLGSSPQALVDFNGDLFFSAKTEALGAELWRSDGSEAGTSLVKDINTGAAGSNPGHRYTDDDHTRLVIGSILYFKAEDSRGLELWKTDGTTDGTSLVKDLATGASSFPGEMTDLEGTLVFRAHTPQTGAELWRSDGTPEGTELIQDLTPGSGSSNPIYVTASGGSVYFRTFAHDSRDGTLYRSDGSVGSITAHVPGFGSLFHLTDVDETLYFNGSSSLWKATATSASPVRSESPAPTGPYLLTDIEGVLYFAANDGLWRSDGTGEGTFNIYDSGFLGMTDQIVPIGGGRFAFSAANHQQLWISDGTRVGTSLVIQTNPSGDSKISNVTAYGGRIYFAASRPQEGLELWQSDGTPDGTALLKDINGLGYGSLPSSGVEVNSVLFFAADDGVTGSELWRTDGTMNGTWQVVDLFPGPNGSSISQLMNVSGTLFFLGRSSNLGDPRVWRSDGTASGTVLVTTADGFSLNSPNELTEFRGSLFFSGGDAPGGIELWKTDGTSATASRFLDIRPGNNSGRPQEMTVVGDTLYFSAQDANGRELWKSNGSVEETVRITDIAISSASSNPTELTAIGEEIFFIAQLPNGRWGLYISNGSTDGTVLLKNLNTTKATELTAVDDLLYFVLPTPTGSQLWQSDGTVLGTKQVLMAGVSLVRNLLAVERRLYFSATTVAAGEELWVLEDPSQVAKMLLDIIPGPTGSGAKMLFDFNGLALFSAKSPEHGLEVWQTLGQTFTTRLFADVNPGPRDSVFRSFSTLGGRLFFSAYSNGSGDELHAGKEQPIDLEDGGMVARGTNPDSVRALLQSGRGGVGGVASGKWNGTRGITSSVAADAFRNSGKEELAVGYALNGNLLKPYKQFQGETVLAEDILMRLTRNGDADLDGVVGNNDITILAGFYRPGVTGKHWYEGDFNYDGEVNNNDITILAGFYRPEQTPAAPGVEETQVIVPEQMAPTAIHLENKMNGFSMRDPIWWFDIDSRAKPDLFIE